MAGKKNHNSAHTLESINKLIESINSHSLEVKNEEVEFMVQRTGEPKELIREKIKAVRTAELNKKNLLLKLLYAYI